MRNAWLAVFLAAAAFAAPQALTPEEIREGWILLFDGETLFGWTAEGGVKWKVADGAIVGGEGEPGWLRSDTQFGDFVLRLEFRTRATGNSGVFLRAAREGRPHETGYELQIWDQNEKFPTGSLVNVARGRDTKIRPDDWNEYEVHAEGPQFRVRLNGKEVLKASDPRSALGHFGLQYNKDNKIEFRNLRLRPLGLQPLFNGKNLDGWREVKAPKPPQAPPEWTVRNQMIHVEKGPGQLETTSLFKDFLLQLEVRANSNDPNHHPNSGVFFRGTPGGYWNGYESQLRNEYKAGDRMQPVDFGTGGIYRQQAARKVVANDNEFFTKTVVAQGRHIAVWVNGYPVSNWDDARPEADSARSGAAVGPGTISLQAHDPTTNLDFRNIRIASIEAR